jgi:drug/metabolite transporter (DMT)-like permease
VIYTYSRRIGINPLAAAVVAPFFLAWGAFDRVGYWAPEAIFAICLCLLMCHFDWFITSQPSAQKELAGILLATLAIFIQSICVAVVPVTVAVLAVRRRWRSMLISCIPLVVYVLWYVTYQRRDDAYRWPIGGAYPQDRNISLYLEFGWKSLSRTVWQTANFPTFLLIAILIGVGGIHLIRQGGNKRVYAVSAIGASFIYLSGFVWARGFATLRIFRQEIPSRYVSVLAILLLPIAGLGLSVLVVKIRDRHGLTRTTRNALIVTSFLLLIASTAFQKYDRHNEDMEFARSTRDRLTTEMADPSLATKQASDFVFGDIVWMDIIYSDLLRFRRLGWL